MKSSVTDFSAPIGASVFKFCVHLQVGKDYCVNGNLDANHHLTFFFQFFIFSFFHSYILEDFENASPYFLHFSCKPYMRLKSHSQVLMGMNQSFT